MNQFAFKLLHHLQRNQSQPFLRLKNLKACNLTTSKTASSCGTSSTILDPIQKPVSRRPSFVDPTKVASLSATPCIVSTPTSKNPNGLSLCKPSTTPSHGGRESQPQKLPHFELLGRWVQTWQTPCVGSLDDGTFVCWNTRFHAMRRPSKPSSSSMYHLLTSSATTNQLWRLGPPPHHPCVAVKDGKDIKRRFRTQTRLTGSCLDPCSEIIFLRNSPCWQGDLFKTKSSLQSEIFFSHSSEAFQRWCKENGLPSIPRSQCADLGQALWSTHTSNITQHITRNSIQLLECLPL